MEPPPPEDPPEEVQALETRLDTLGNQLAAVRNQLHEVTAEFVEKLAWVAQLERTGLKQQQALNGWLALPTMVRRVTLGGCPGASTAPVSIPPNAPIGLVVYYAGFSVHAAGSVLSVTPTKSFVIG